MKKLLTIICICLTIAAFAQHESPYAETEIKVGEKVPSHPLKAFKNAENGISDLGDLKGRPLLLIFWPYACSVGQDLVWDLHGIMKNIKGINVHLVSMASEERIRFSLNRMEHINKTEFPFSSADSTLYRMFPHRYSPHVIWIDKDGTVKAITDQTQVNRENIQRLALGKKLALPLKEQIWDDELFYVKQPIIATSFPYTNPSTQGFSYLGAGHIAGQYHTSTLEYNKETGLLRCLYFDTPLYLLYKLAFRKMREFHDSRIIFENFTDQDSIKQHYTYELLTRDTSLKKVYETMRMDLDRYLGITSSLEKRKVKVLVLNNTSSKARYKTDNTRIESYEENGLFIMENLFIGALVNNIFNNGSLLPYTVINNTGYNGRINIKFCNNTKDIACINHSLKDYDLRLDEDYREMEVLVIRKNNF